ncbi:hypothetical protein ABE073_04185 [Lederbergia citrisecunda]|uniref:hypothetical protein n=1 Tax=Lederbergia citrisecunda TaxID=2833583 RepID=UPI003D2DCA52
MNIIEQKERNAAAREGVETLTKVNGLKLGFIAKQLEMSSLASFSHWRHGKYDFGKDRLDQVENLISKYK